MASVVFAPWNAVVYVFPSDERTLDERSEDASVSSSCDICESSSSALDDVTCLPESITRPKHSPAKSRKAGTPEHVDKRVSRVALRLKSKIGNQTKLAACNWTTLGLVYTLVVSIDRVNTLQPRRLRINTEKIFCISLGFTFGVITESRVFSRLLGVHGRQHTFSLLPSLIYSSKKKIMNV